MALHPSQYEPLNWSAIQSTSSGYIVIIPIAVEWITAFQDIQRGLVPFI